MSSSRDTLHLVMEFSEAQLATASVAKRLEDAENKKRPNQKNLETLRKEPDAMKVAEDEALHNLQTVLSRLEMASSETDRPFPPTIPIMEEEETLCPVVEEPIPRVVPAERVPVAPVRGANRQVAINPPEKYKHGDDFTLWSARFKRYVKMAGINDEQSLWTLLNQVDDRTAEKLDPV